MINKRLLATLGTVLPLIMLLASLVTAGTPPTQVYTIKFWIQNPQTAWQAEPFKRFIADVNQKTNGQVVLQPFWAESLAPGKEAVNGLKGGLLELAQLQTFNNPGEFPVSDVAGLPFLAVSTRGVVEGLRKLYGDGLMPEYNGKGFKLLDFHAPGMQYLLFRNKQIDTLAGINGLKIRSQTPVTVDMLKAFGATPVSFPSSDVYMALDRGVIDGALSSPGFMAPNKFYEAAKFLLDQPLYGGNMFVAMNQKTWDRLPSDLQKIMQDCIKVFTDDWLVVSKTQEEINSMNILKEKGVTIYKLRPEELAKFKQAVAPVIDKFVANMDKLGLQGRKIVDTFASAQPK